MTPMWRIVPAATPDATPCRLRSPSAIMALGLRHGDALILMASGPAAQAAIDALADLIETGMGELRPLDRRPFRPQRLPRLPRLPLLHLLRCKPGERLIAVTAAAGYAIGQAAWLERPEPPRAASEGAAAERARFAQGRAALAADLDGRAQAQEGSEQAGILIAHRQLLDDEDILDAVDDGIAQGDSASQAWHAVMQARAAALRAAPDPHIAQRADDFVDLEWQLQWHLAGQTPPPVALPDAAIVIAAISCPRRLPRCLPGRLPGWPRRRAAPPRMWRSSRRQQGHSRPGRRRAARAVDRARHAAAARCHGRHADSRSRRGHLGRRAGRGRPSRRAQGRRTSRRR
jgi:phosphocarrier protein FPr/phosphocarrier protein